MSNAVFPILAGLQWNIKKTPIFNTIVQRSASLAELRGSFTSAPVYVYQLSYDVLRDTVAYNELKTLMGFFETRDGSFDSFLYADPDDSSAVVAPFGTGDGVTVAFQLTRPYGDATQPVTNLAGNASIYANAVLQTSNYSVSNLAVVTFNTAPAANVPLTWSGSYYYRCRFGDLSTYDALDFNQFMHQLWEAKTVVFTGSLGTKI